VTHLVTSACSFSFSLACFSFSSIVAFLPLVPLLHGILSDYLGGLSLGGPIYGATVPATRLVTSACCLSSSFAFAILLSLPLVRSSPEAAWLCFPFLSLCLFHLIYYADRNYSSSSLSFSSSSMVSIAGGAAPEDSAALS
jgi:hypothetical protein